MKRDPDDESDLEDTLTQTSHELRPRKRHRTYQPEYQHSSPLARSASTINSFHAVNPGPSTPSGWKQTCHAQVLIIDDISSTCAAQALRIFTLQAELDRLKAQILGARSLTCPVLDCEKTVERSDRLYQHIRRSKEKRHAECARSLNEKQCGTCQKPFKHLFRHQAKVHREEYTTRMRKLLGVDASFEGSIAEPPKCFESVFIDALRGRNCHGDAQLGMRKSGRTDSEDPVLGQEDCGSLLGEVPNAYVSSSAPRSDEPGLCVSPSLDRCFEDVLEDLNKSNEKPNGLFGSSSPIGMNAHLDSSFGLFGSPN